MIQIPLTQGYVAIVDDEDAHLAEHKWFAFTPKPGLVYGRRNIPAADGQPRRGLLLHRAVLRLSDPSKLVDHRDGDGLNCRRRNLRVTSFQTNARNRSGAQRNSTSGHLGVRERRGKWNAQIKVAGRVKHLGTFDTVEEAIASRLAAEKALWGIQPRRAAAHNTTGEPQ